MPIHPDRSGRNGRLRERGKEVGGEGEDSLRSTDMIVHITRFVFVTAGALGGFAVSRLIDWSGQVGYPEYLVIFLFIILGWSIGYVVGGITGRELSYQFSRLEERVRELSAADFLLGTVGLLVGLLLAWLGSLPLRLVRPEWLAVVSTVLLYALGATLGAQVARIKSADLARAFPKLSGDDGSIDVAPRAGVKLLDTSAIIDGRFADLRSLGILEGEARVPRFVLGELQTLADSADDIKRARGRRGLDLLKRLQEGAGAPTVFETDYQDLADVDSKLMRLAAETSSTLVTVDYNMARVAGVRGIKVVNLNEVANALRPAFLPGEPLRLRIVKDGKEPDQGVGYLEDGTMVVVQDGRPHVGLDVDAEVTSVLQTSAGRMIFARFVEVAGSDVEQPDNQGAIGP